MDGEGRPPVHRDVHDTAPAMFALALVLGCLAHLGCEVVLRLRWGAAVALRCGLRSVCICFSPQVLGDRDGEPGWR